MIWSIAWRNIWRNKTRSLVVIIAIILGLFGTLFIIALSNGMVDQKVDASISNEISHIQIHDTSFLKNNIIDHHMSGVPEILTGLEGMEKVEAACARLRINGMATTANNGAGVTINGIMPEREKRVTKIHTALIDGDYFERESSIPLILISRKLAEKLKARVKSKIVLNIQDTGGNQVRGLFRVTGIYKTSNGMWDEQNVYVNKKDLHELVLLAESKATEVAVLLKNTEDTEAVSEVLASKFPDLEVMSWKELDPMLVGISSMMDQFSYLLVVVILIALAFSIINTMLMAILERTQEIGMLRAVGMSGKRVFNMIMLETIFLSLVGAVIGIAISISVIQATGVQGINFSAWAEGFENLGYSSHVYPSIYYTFYITITVMVIFTALFSSVFPARKALRLNPAEAVREDA
jgi:ABC-type lipoprotein release transport system permease subunit